jgi:hypothetical protein
MRQFAGLIPTTEAAQLSVLAEFLQQMTGGRKVINRFGNEG